MRPSIALPATPATAPSVAVATGTAIDLIACAPVALTVEPASLIVEPVSFTAEAAADAPPPDAALLRPRVFDAADRDEPDRVAPDLLDPEDRLEPALRPRVPAPELDRWLPLRELPDAPPDLRELALRAPPLALPELLLAPRELLPEPREALLALRELPLREPPLRELAAPELPLARPPEAPLALEPDLEDFVVAADFPFGDDLSLVVRAL